MQKLTLEVAVEIKRKDTKIMTNNQQLLPRESFIRALRRDPPTGQVPHFELVFFLTMEVLGKVHPSHRNYEQWIQMSEKERNLHRNEMADIFIDIAEKYHHSAIFIHPNPCTEEETVRMVNLIREKTGYKYFLMLHGDSTFAIPPGDRFAEFIYRIADEPEKILAEAAVNNENALLRAERLKKECDLDGFALCSDYCMNENPFLPPEQFARFITPYLKELIEGYRSMGYYTIKHTDGNIMPILDQLVDCRPDALHSLDPQGGVDIAEVKRLYGDQLCLIGNVNCGLMDTGTDEEVIQSARYALEKGMPGGGYIFSTSNCVYTGMRLERYELIHKVL